MNAENKYRPSNLARRELCPGSAQMELRYGVEEESEAAEEGTMLHGRVDIQEEIDDLTPEQQELIASCRATIKEFVPEGGCWGCEYKLKMEIAGQTIDGTADVAIFGENEITIIDWKFGRVPVSPDALQIGAYAIMVAQAYESRKITVVIHQPRLGTTIPTTLEADDLHAIEERITRIIELCESVAGRWMLRPSELACQHCSARRSCPAIFSDCTDIAWAEKTKPLITADNAQSVLILASMAERWAREAKADIRKLALEAEDSGGLQGVTLSRRAGNREAPDPQALFDTLAAYIPANAFLAACKVSVRTVEEAYVGHRKTAGVTGAEARREFAKLTDGLVRRGKERIEVRINK